MDKIILLLCSLISCIIVTSILFQFWSDRYKKVFTNRYIYYALPIAMIMIVMAVNMIMNPLLNFSVNILLVGIISYFFYYEDSANQVKTVLESESLIIIAGIFESLGVFLIDTILNFLNIMPQSIERQQSIETAFSKLIVLFLYYAVFRRIWEKSVTLTKTQYILYAIMFSYSAVNIIVLSAISSQESSIVLVMMAGFTIFTNMFLLYFIKFTDERNYYKSKADMMEQQVELQFSFYQEQSDKYAETRSILHDIENHIKVIERFYQEGQENEALNYTQQIRDKLYPLTPYKYTSNPILNCLLSDKTRTTDKLGIKFVIDFKGVDVDFMYPMDITTLFGNLIDNAITACKKCKENKSMYLEVKKFNDMISISIENSICEEITIIKGKIVNKNEVHRGIGLMNIQKCIDRYDGSIIYKVNDSMLTCDIIINQAEDKNI